MFCDTFFFIGRGRADRPKIDQFWHDPKNRLLTKKNHFLKSGLKRPKNTQKRLLTQYFVTLFFFIGRGQADLPKIDQFWHDPKNRLLAKKNDFLKSGLKRPKNTQKRFLTQCFVTLFFFIGRRSSWPTKNWPIFTRSEKSN